MTREDQYCNYQRKDSIATKSTASGSNDSSQPKRGSPPLLDSIVGNTVWNRLLASESVWDSLNVTRNEDEDVLPQEIYYREKSRQSSAAVLCLTVWYEIRHFLKTTFAHPHILFTSLAVTGVVAGMGMWAITFEKDAHVNEKMATASFVAKETAAYFSNEFKRAFVPLYSLRAAVQHSGYFDDLVTKIGRYPNLLKAGDVEVPGGLANVRDVGGICDDVSALQKWEDLLDASTIENNDLFCELDKITVRHGVYKVATTGNRYIDSRE